MVMVPVLFICGVVFGYFVALPRAVNFLQNFNDSSFDILIRATDYYRFSVILLALIGPLFQVPVGVLAVTRLGIISAKQLARNRGYVILALAVLAAVATPDARPGDDARSRWRRSWSSSSSASCSPASSSAAEPRAADERVGPRTTTCRILRTPCCSTFAAADAAAPSRSSTSRSPSSWVAASCCSASAATPTAACSTRSRAAAAATSSVSDTFNKRLDDARAAREDQPAGRGGAGQLAKLRFQLAGTGENYDQTEQAYTAKGKAAAAPGRERVAALPDAQPDEARRPDRRHLMVQALRPAGLQHYAEAVKAHASS